MGSNYGWSLVQCNVRSWGLLRTTTICGQASHRCGSCTTTAIGAALRSIEDSLQRMLTDRIDVVLIHDCDRYGHGDNQPTVFEEAMTGAARALFELRDEGVVGAVGLGVNEADVCIAAARRADFDVFLLAGRYTLLEQESLDDLLPLCVQEGISLLLGGVYNSGILATGAIPGAHHNYQPAGEEVLVRVAEIEKVCARIRCRHRSGLAPVRARAPRGGECANRRIHNASASRQLRRRERRHSRRAMDRTARRRTGSPRGSYAKRQRGRLARAGPADGPKSAETGFVRPNWRPRSR